MMRTCFITLAISLLAANTSLSQTNTFPSSGYVGIGTISPSCKLDIVGGHTDTRFRLYYNGGGVTDRQSSLNFWASEPGQTYRGAGIGHNLRAYATGFPRVEGSLGASYIRFVDEQIMFGQVSSTGAHNERIRISSTGNLGIGTTSPTARLHVNGGQIRLANTAGQTPFEILSYSNSHSLWFMSGNSTTSTIVLSPAYALNFDRGVSFSYTPGSTGTESGYLRIGQLVKNHSNWTHGITQFYTSGKEQMRITAIGSVAIGTTDPKGYKLAVAGKIVAEEVVIKLQSAWPDYVFQPDYTLRPLSEVEAHIGSHRHLPDVPSAAVVEEQGVSLGEMNAILLRKIEELTLYSIEQEKEAARQSNRIEVQEEYLVRQNQKIDELEQLIRSVINP